MSMCWSAHLQGRWKDVHESTAGGWWACFGEFHCCESSLKKNDEMIKTIKKTVIFSDPISWFSRFNWLVLGNDGQQQDGKAAGYRRGWQKLTQQSNREEEGRTDCSTNGGGGGWMAWQVNRGRRGLDGSMAQWVGWVMEGVGRIDGLVGREWCWKDWRLDSGRGVLRLNNGPAWSTGQCTNVADGPTSQRGRRSRSADVANGMTRQLTDTPTNLTALFSDPIGWFCRSDWLDLHGNGPWRGGEGCGSGGCKVNTTIKMRGEGWQWPWVWGVTLLPVQWWTMTRQVGCGLRGGE